MCYVVDMLQQNCWQWFSQCIMIALYSLRKLLVGHLLCVSLTQQLDIDHRTLLMLGGKIYGCIFTVTLMVKVLAAEPPTTFSGMIFYILCSAQISILRCQY